MIKGKVYRFDLPDTLWVYVYNISSGGYSLEADCAYVRYGAFSTEHRGAAFFMRFGEVEATPSNNIAKRLRRLIKRGKRKVL